MLLAKRIAGIILNLGIATCVWAQADAYYKFTPKVEVKHTAIKDQQNTGTCWSFGTVSFLESEILRTHAQELNLSEMYIVRYIYLDKAFNYHLRQGKTQFSQGSLAHDAIRAMQSHGLMTEETYSGLPKGAVEYDHEQLFAIINSLLQEAGKQKMKWSALQQLIEAPLDMYLGKIQVDAANKKQKMSTPREFAKSFNLDAANFVGITSFTHHPFYESFAVEVPDNYSSGLYMNVPLQEMEQIVDNALAQGYTIVWDGDVSEAAFQHDKGIAVVPASVDKEKSFLQKPMPEKAITQENRQEAFENFETQDDHLMHLVGSATDQNGNKYYIIKNSWGADNPYKGYLYMSAAYFRYKTVALLLHKDGIPKDLRIKMKF